MKTVLERFGFIQPTSLADALQKMSSDHALKPFAGGTDLMVETESGLLTSAEFLDISSLKELRQIEEKDGDLWFGALCSYTDILTHPLFKGRFPLMHRAAMETAAPAIQNRGTIGGNVMNASPAADTPPALLVYNAKLELTSAAGSRVVSYAEFHQDYKKTQKKDGELLTRIALPLDELSGLHWYSKIGTRRMQAISKVIMAAYGLVETGTIKDIRLGFGSVAATPVRALACEKFLVGQKISQIDLLQLKKELSQVVRPISDVRSTAEYRAEVAGNLVEQFLGLLDSGAETSWGMD